VIMVRPRRVGRCARRCRPRSSTALRLAADGTRADLEELGRLAHVDLRPSEATVWADELHLQALTPRVLGYPVQGLTSPRSPRRW
jgi:hypothetical protein